MPTSKVIRPAVFDETGEHVIPADADLNLDPVSSDPDNYIVRGSDGGAFLNGDGVLSNDGENLLKTSPNDGKVTYPRSGAVDLIRDTMQAALDAADERVNNAQDAADKAQAAADKAAEDAAAAQCTATQALNDAADAQADADKAQARADAAYDKAADAQCAAADALDKAQEAVDKLPEIAAEHVTVVTAGDGIKVDHTKNFSHNVYQVSVKRNGEDSGLISSTDGLEVELKGNGGIDKDKDGLYVDQQWIDEMVARYAKDHMLFNQFKIVSSLPAIPDADVHTLYLIRNRDSSATDAGTKDSFDGWFIATTENGTQKWEESGYKTDLTGYTHTGNTVNITGYVSGTGTVDDDGNVTVRVLPDIGNRTYTYYVGKTNAKNWWGYDENGNEWGSTKDHPFASLVYAINQSNMHIFPGNSINICVLDAGEYDESYLGLSVKSSTYVYSTAGSHPVFRMSSDMNLDSDLIFNGIDFRIHRCSSRPANGQPFFRLFKIGSLIFRGACHMVADFDNFGGNWWPFIVLSGNTKVSFNYMEGKIPLFLEVTPGVTISGCFRFTETAGFGLCTTGDNSPDPAVACRINAPAGSKIAGCVVSVDRAGSVSMGETPYPEAHRLVFDWGIADQSSLVQVNLGKYSYLWLYKNPNAGQPLPGHDVGSVPDSADYVRNDL